MARLFLFLQYCKGSGLHMYVPNSTSELFFLLLSSSSLLECWPATQGLRVGFPAETYLSRVCSSRGWRWLWPNLYIMVTPTWFKHADFQDWHPLEIKLKLCIRYIVDSALVWILNMHFLHPLQFFLFIIISLWCCNSRSLNSYKSWMPSSCPDAEIFKLYEI